MNQLEQPETPLRLGMVLFENFELLDVFGPLEMFGALQNQVELVMLGEQTGAIRSNQGPCGYVEQTLAACNRVDILFVPGGQGTRREVSNTVLLEQVQRLATTAHYVASVCTGAALLAKAGLLDGMPATTNKLAFDWVTHQGPSVDWQLAARWVDAGKFWTSSGVSAGIDMSLALIAHLFGRDTSLEVAHYAEYLWQEDASQDPFSSVER